MDGLERAYKLAEVYLRLVQKLTDEYYLTIPAHLRNDPRKPRIIDLEVDDGKEEYD